MESIKQHPYLVGGAIILAIGAYMLLSSGNGTSSGPTADLGSVYGAQAAAQTATNQINAQLAGQQNQLGAQIAGLTIQSQTAKDLAGINMNVELAKINAAQEVTDLANTLTANVAMKQIQGQVDVESIRGNVQENQFNNLASVLIAQTNAAAATAQAAISSQCHGFGCLF